MAWIDIPPSHVTFGVFAGSSAGATVAVAAGDLKFLRYKLIAPDTVVIDEPLYAAYLARTGIDHPVREAVIASQPTDLATAVAGLSEPLPPGRRVHYAKHMAHHVSRDMDLRWTLGFYYALLIRDPGEVVSSYVRSREACEPADIGLLQQQRLADSWRRRGIEAPVIDASDFLHDPEGHLRWMCDWLGIAFTDRMLSWPAGPRPTDGVWAPYWYDSVLGSTGFEPWRPREVHLNQHDAAVAEACRPAYEQLREGRVRL
jgi:hypothetical protein